MPIPLVADKVNGNLNSIFRSKKKESHNLFLFSKTVNHNIIGFSQKLWHKILLRFF